jgi:hypothetical protein
VTSRIAALGPARLARPAVRDGVPPVERVRPVLQHLADVAAQAEGRGPRAVPELEPHAVADQLVVLVRDVLAATAGAGDRDAVLDDVHGRLVQLRRVL